jgi:glycosyltransferase involved in cell wall biosynthesis
VVTVADHRVLQLLGPSAGGIRRHVATLADGLTERGWSVEVAGPPGVMAGVGPQHHDVDVPRDPRAVTAIRYLGPLLRGYDVVHAHGLTVGWAASLVRRRPPLVLSVHNLVLDEVEGRMAPVLRRMEGALPGRVDHTIAISDDVARRFEGRVPADQLTVVAPVGPVPRALADAGAIRASLGIAADAPLIVLVGRLHPQKDVGGLLDAVAEVVRPVVPEVRVVIVGEGPEREALVAKSRRLGLDAAVRFAGDQANAADFMATADVVVMSSIWESFGLVVSEALQLGRPVVATAVGAAPRMVTDGRTGRLVEPGDPSALGQAIVDLLADPVAAAAMGAAGREAVRAEFGPDALVDKVAGIYTELIGGTR